MEGPLRLDPPMDEYICTDKQFRNRYDTLLNDLQQDQSTFSYDIYLLIEFRVPSFDH